MPKYKVIAIQTVEHIVEAANEWQAALAFDEEHDGQIVSVKQLLGRPPSKKVAKRATKKRAPMSAATRAKLAKNLVKARAARAAKAKAAKR